MNLPNTNVIVIRATNRPNIIELTLHWPGRFNRELEIAILNKDGRHEILQIKMSDMKIQRAKRYGSMIQEEVFRG